MGLVRRCDWRITYQEYPTVFSTSARRVLARRVARDAEVTVNMAFALPAIGEVATRIVVPQRTPDFDGLSTASRSRTHLNFLGRKPGQTSMFGDKLIGVFR
jgi:hypothetical protein